MVADRAQSERLKAANLASVAVNLIFRRLCCEPRSRRCQALSHHCRAHGLAATSQTLSADRQATDDHDQRRSACGIPYIV
jgi:hypothetical protein